MAVAVFGQALALPNISALISRTTAHDRQGAMLGLNMSVGALARAIGPIAGGALFSIVGADAPLFAAALVLAGRASGLAGGRRGAPALLRRKRRHR